MATLTEPQMRAMAQFVADYGGGEAEDYIDEVAATRDDFGHYLNAEGWAEWAGQDVVDRYDFPAIHYDRVQAVKGQQRYELFVMDFGDVRGIYQV